MLPINQREPPPMSKPVTHFSNIRRLADRTITGTLCNRMTSAEINCSQFRTDVTCKFCLRALAAQENGAARATFRAEA